MIITFSLLLFIKLTNCYSDWNLPEINLRVNNTSTIDEFKMNNEKIIKIMRDTFSNIYKQRCDPNYQPSCSYHACSDVKPVYNCIQGNFVGKKTCGECYKLKGMNLNLSMSNLAYAKTEGKLINISEPAVNEMATITKELEYPFQWAFERNNAQWHYFGSYNGIFRKGTYSGRTGCLFIPQRWFKGNF